jgi:hypothetical protein
MLRKDYNSAWFWARHHFSRVDKSFPFVIPSGLQPARNLLIKFIRSLFSCAVEEHLKIAASALVFGR